MAERILPAASLSAVASPVDRYVSPAMETSNGWDEIADSLSSINPKLQGVIKTAASRKAETDEAAGAVAANNLDASVALNKNKEGWSGLIAQVRKEDAANGTSNADALVGVSPHFQRGLVKTKTQRAAMGLGNHVQMQWDKDVGGIKGIDDPRAVAEWLQKQTDAYSKAAGVENIDPLLIAEIYNPQITQVQTQMISGHNSYRAKERVGEYTREFAGAIGMIASGAHTGSSSVEDFIGRMTTSESSGDSSVINSEGYGGWLQFGQDRLDDYNNQHGTNITVREFAKNEALQKRVNVWHVNAIDKEIDASGYLELGYSRDGLRAVRHLGGWGGVQKFVANGGKSDIKDSNGTTLSAYYNKFAGSAAAMQQSADQAVSNGLSPAVVNKQLVESVIAQAKTTGDPRLLDILDQVDTGHGPLGNVAWVKEARLKAAEAITDENWETSQREAEIERQQRAEDKRDLNSSAVAAIIADPNADIGAFVSAANASGEAELAVSLVKLQHTLKQNSNVVQTDHERFTELRTSIFRGDLDKDALANQINDAVTQGQLTGSQANSLIDDLGTFEESEDFLRDPQVRNWVDNAVSEIRDLTEQKDLFGNVLVSGREVSNRFEEELTDELLSFLGSNPDASKADVRLFTRKKARELKALPDYQKRDVGSEPTALEADAPIAPAALDAAAAQYGMETSHLLLAAEAAGMTPTAYISFLQSTQ